MPGVISMRGIRLAVGVILLAISVSAAVYFPLWPKMLVGLTTNLELAPHSWLTIRIILLSLLLPGLLCLTWTPGHQIIVSAQRIIDGLSGRMFLLIVLSFAALVRIIAVVIMPLRLWADWDTYHRLALLWAATGEYTIGAQPTAYFPPGWPYFLSRLYLIFGGIPEIGNAANIILGVGIVYLGFRIARRIWGTAAARWTAIVLAVFPSQVLFANILCSEILFTALFLAFVDLITGRSPSRAKTVLLCYGAGLLLGMATLTRSLTLLLPLIMIPFFHQRTDRKTTAILHWLILSLGLATLTVPWIVRNYHQVGRATISTNGGVDFYAGNHPPAAEEYSLLRPSKLPWDTSRDEVHLDRLGYQLGWAHIRRDPAGFLIRGAQKVLFMMTSETGPFTYELLTAARAGKSTAYIWPAAVAQGYYLVFLGFVGLGLIMLIRDRHRRNPGAYLLLLITGYWLAVHFVFFGIGRFHFPLVPVLAGFAGSALAEITRRAANRPSANAV